MSPSNVTPTLSNSRSRLWTYSRRKKMRYSAPLTVSSLNGAVCVVLMWHVVEKLTNVTILCFGEMMLLLVWMVPNYESCTLVTTHQSESGLHDVTALFERQAQGKCSDTL